jgi:hypothetical protein
MEKRIYIDEEGTIHNPDSSKSNLNHDLEAEIKLLQDFQKIIMKLNS